MHTHTDMHCAFLHTSSRSERCSQACQAMTKYLGGVDRIGRIDRTRSHFIVGPRGGTNITLHYSGGSTDHLPSRRETRHVGVLELQAGFLLSIILTAACFSGVFYFLDRNLSTLRIWDRWLRMMGCGFLGRIRPRQGCVRALHRQTNDSSQTGRTQSEPLPTPRDHDCVYKGSCYGSQPIPLPVGRSNLILMKSKHPTSGQEERAREQASVGGATCLCS